MGILNWPDYLRAAGIPVAEHNNWRTNRPLGNLPDRPKIVWHHDASPPGPSPGALDWIIGAYNRQDASAQIWVGYDGIWHFVGSGVAWHTGAVLPGMPDNFSAVGVETDETVGENWSVALLDSLRRGTAAIAAAEGYDPDDWLHFHKTICKPVGRKSDPEGLSLGSERATCKALMRGVAALPAKPVLTKPDQPAGGGGADPKPEEEDEDVAYIVRRDNRTQIDYFYDKTIFKMIADPTHYDLLRNAGLIKEPHGTAATTNTWDLEWVRGQIENEQRRLGIWKVNEDGSTVGLDRVIQPGK